MPTRETMENGNIPVRPWRLPIPASSAYTTRTTPLHWMTAKDTMKHERSTPERILIVDDEPTMRRLLEHLLSQQGYTLFLAKDGEEAIKLARSESPDLILLDVRMPRMDGFEAARRIREDKSFASVPILFLTAHQDSEDKREGFNVGADDFIVKPFDSDELVARVASHLRRRRGAAAYAEEARVETLSQLMVTLAHYLNNALTVMSGRNEITKEDDPEAVRRLKASVREGTRKIQMVVQSLEEMAADRRVEAADYVGMKRAMLDIHDRLATKLADVEKQFNPEG